MGTMKGADGRREGGEQDEREGGREQDEREGGGWGWAALSSLSRLKSRFSLTCEAHPHPPHTQDLIDQCYRIGDTHTRLLTNTHRHTTQHHQLSHQTSTHTHPHSERPGQSKKTGSCG